jgi:hypothetical protein
VGENKEGSSENVREPTENPLDTADNQKTEQFRIESGLHL